MNNTSKHKNKHARQEALNYIKEYYTQGAYTKSFAPMCLSAVIGYDEANLMNLLGYKGNSATAILDKHPEIEDNEFNRKTYKSYITSEEEKNKARASLTSLDNANLDTCYRQDNKVYFGVSAKVLAKELFISKDKVTKKTSRLVELELIAKLPAKNIHGQKATIYSIDTVRYYKLLCLCIAYFYEKASWDRIYKEHKELIDSFGVFKAKRPFTGEISHGDINFYKKSEFATRQEKENIKKPTSIMQDDNNREEEKRTARHSKRRRQRETEDDYDYDD